MRYNLHNHKANLLQQLLIVILYITYLVPYFAIPMIFDNKNIHYSSYMLKEISYSKTQNVSYIRDNKILARNINNGLEIYLNDHDNVTKVIDDHSMYLGIFYKYDTYGNLLKIPNKSSKKNLRQKNSNNHCAQPIPNQFFYNCQRFDMHTQLQYLQARFYFANLNRFINEDSYHLSNRFNYANSNPVQNSDLSGHSPISRLKKISLAIMFGTISCFPVFSGTITFLFFLMNSGLNWYNSKKTNVDELTKSISTSSETEQISTSLAADTTISIMKERISISIKKIFSLAKIILKFDTLFCVIMLFPRATHAITEGLLPDDYGGNDKISFSDFMGDNFLGFSKESLEIIPFIGLISTIIDTKNDFCRKDKNGKTDLLSGISTLLNGAMSIFLSYKIISMTRSSTIINKSLERLRFLHTRHR